MTAETLMIAMNYLESDVLSFEENEKKQKNNKRLILLTAACFVFIVAVIALINIIVSNNLPKIELTVNKNIGMGFEGPFLKNPDDFESDNPWKNSFSTFRLPVYENNSHDENGTPCGLNEAQLNETLHKTASSLGITVESVSKDWANDLYGGYENDFVYCITGETSIASITVNAAGGVTVFFKTPVSLPFSFNVENNNDAEKALKFHSENYSDLISAFIISDETELCISTEYNAFGEIHRSYRVYDSSGNTKNDILNYNLNFADFRIESNGALTSIYICNNSSVINETAQYPIISETKAKTKLLEGDYISSVVQYDFSGEEYIAKTDLVYKCEKGETVAPYYRFLVELPEAPDANGNKSYGIYYVPAIDDKYISNITLIDGEIQ